MTTVLVTHDIQEAVYMGRQILIAGRPPIDRCEVIENPEARQPGYRQSPEFFARCAELRSITAESGTGRRGDEGSGGVVGDGGPAGPTTTGGEGMPSKGQSSPTLGRADTAVRPYKLDQQGTR